MVAKSYQLQLALRLLNITSYVLFDEATSADWLAYSRAALITKNTSGWRDNVHTPTSFRSINFRRAVVCLWGEVFWQMHYNETCEVVVSRARHRLPTKARLVHYTQYEQYLSKFTVKPYPKTKRCAFMTSYVTKFSGAESVARWALFAITAERYGCEFIGRPHLAKEAGLGSYVGEHCRLSWHLCFKDYKVGLVGENSFHEGYVTEKLALPQLVGAMPLYLGAPDVRKYSANLVECKISPTNLAVLRKLATGKKWNVKAKAAELVTFARILLALDFKPCIAAISAYMK